MIFGRIMAYVGSEHGLVGHGIITKVFVAADVGAILTQATGGSMLVSYTGISPSTCSLLTFGIQRQPEWWRKLCQDRSCHSHCWAGIPGGLVRYLYVYCTGV